MKSEYSIDKKEKREKLLSALLIAGLSVILVLLIVWIAGISKEDSSDADTPITGNVAAESTSIIGDTASSSAASQNSSSQDKGNTETTKASDEKNETTTVPSTQPPLEGKPSNMTTEEIVKLFNEASDKVKTQGTKLVKNYEKRKYLPELVDMPIMKDTFSNLLAENFVDDYTPMECTSREDIIARYPVPGESWSSRLTAADVSKAECIEGENEYEVTLYVNSGVEPQPGTSVAKAFEAMTSEEAMADAPEIIDSFEAVYDDCYIKCRIDKKNRRVTSSSYFYTVITKVGINMMVTKVTAQFGVAFERNYSISY